MIWYDAIKEICAGVSDPDLTLSTQAKTHFLTALSAGAKDEATSMEDIFGLHKTALLTFVGNKEDVSALKIARPLDVYDEPTNKRYSLGTGWSETAVTVTDTQADYFQGTDAIKISPAATIAVHNANIASVLDRWDNGTPIVIYAKDSGGDTSYISMRFTDGDSITVKLSDLSVVNNVGTPSVTVCRPNGAETYLSGDWIKIVWEVDTVGTGELKAVGNDLGGTVDATFLGNTDYDIIFHVALQAPVYNFYLKPPEEVKLIHTNSVLAPAVTDFYVYKIGGTMYIYGNNQDGTQASLEYVEYPDDSSWDYSTTPGLGGTELTTLFTIPFLKAAINLAKQTLIGEDLDYLRKQ